MAQQRHVYLAYTRSDRLVVPELLKVFGNHDRAFDWLWDIAQRHGQPVRAGDFNSTVSSQVGPVGEARQWWWLDKKPLD